MDQSLRMEERFAVAVLRGTIGARFTAYDEGRVAGHVDGLFVLPDGREGALEVTTLAEPASMQVEAIAANDWIVPGATWAWMVNVGPAVDMRSLHEHIVDLVLTCERLDVNTPDDALVAPREAFAWYEQNDVSMHGFPETNRPGAIDVLPHGFGGAVSDNLDALPDWLADQFDTPLLGRKLARTERPEQHLFVRVHQSGMPFAFFHPLAWATAVPLASPHGHGSLTALWMVARWSRSALRWSALDGWDRVTLDSAE